MTKPWAPRQARRSLSGPTHPWAPPTLAHPWASRQLRIATRAIRAQDDKGGKGELTAVRLDKFMKVSRLSKRRSEAHEALEHGRITKDGKALKPGYQVKPGDVLEIHYATKFLTVRILDVPLRMTPGVKPADLYEIVGQRRDEPAEWL